MKEIVLFSDGGSRGNPGAAGYGFVIYDVTKRVFNPKNISSDFDIIGQGFKYIGETTNNQAEYQGMYAGIEYVLNNFDQIDHLHIYLDSELIVKQMNRIYKMRNKDLKPWFVMSNEMLKKLGSLYTISHIRREYNKEADALANVAMDRGE